MKERPILFSGAMVKAILSGHKCQTRRVVKQPHQNPLGVWEPFDFGGENGGRDKHGNTTPAQRTFTHTRTGEIIACPIGQPGDRLWVRETFSPIYPQDPTYNGGQPIEYDYAATYTSGDRLGDLIGKKKTWKPSIFMPRAASRITLEITSVRIERLQDISEADARAEGVDMTTKHIYQTTHSQSRQLLLTDPTARRAFERLWETINSPTSWAANPWVWVIDLKAIKK